MGVRVAETTFERATRDRAGGATYLRVAAGIDGAEVIASLEGHTLRLGEDGSVVVLTLLGLRRRCEHEEVAEVTIRRPVDDERFTLHPAEPLAAAISARQRATPAHGAFGPSETSPIGRERGEKRPCS